MACKFISFLTTHCKERRLQIGMQVGQHRAWRKRSDYKLIWRTGITRPEGQVDYKSFGIVVLESQGLEESGGL